MKTIFILVILLALAGFAYYAISPIFMNVEVQDELPENVIIEEPTEEQIMSSGEENLSEEERAQLALEMEAKAAEKADIMNEKMPDRMVEKQPEPGTPSIAIESFTVMPTTGHPASGQVKVLNTTDGAIIRYENLETLNGPNLHIYLAKDLGAKEFIDLGPIKGTRGNINYTVPNDVDLSEYRYVMHWCVPFGVLFNYAQIAR